MQFVQNVKETYAADYNKARAMLSEEEAGKLDHCLTIDLGKLSPIDCQNTC